VLKVSGGAETPVPDSAIDCGEVEALSVSESDTLSAPGEVGANDTVTVQVPLGAIVAPLHVLPTLYPVGFDAAGVAKVRLAVLVLVTVTDWELLVVFTAWLPNPRLLTLKLTGGRPVPVSVIDCGELLALSVRLSV